MPGPLCSNYIFNAFDPTPANALQLVCRNPIQNFNHCVKKADFIGNLLSDQCSLYFPKTKSPREIYLVSKLDEGASSVAYARENFASFLNCEPALYQHGPSIFALDSSQMERNFEPKGRDFDL
jgi:hypothetical protein